jgi:hypothetical protein
MRRYFEFALVVVLVAGLVLLLMRELERATSDMEAAGVQTQVSAIRTQLLESVVHRETFGGRLPASDNPMDWISDRPANYVGERDDAPRETGIWFFDKNGKTLIYRFRDGHMARFRLSRNGGAGNDRGIISGITLLRLDDKTE